MTWPSSTHENTSRAFVVKVGCIKKKITTTAVLRISDNSSSLLNRMSLDRSTEITNAHGAKTTRGNNANMAVSIKNTPLGEVPVRKQPSSTYAVPKLVTCHIVPHQNEIRVVTFDIIPHQKRESRRPGLSMTTYEFLAYIYLGLSG